MSTTASEIASVSNFCSTVCSAADKQKHQSSASLAFVRGIHRFGGNSPVTGGFPSQWASNSEIFQFNNVIVGIFETGFRSDGSTAINQVEAVFENLCQLT